MVGDIVWYKINRRILDKDCLINKFIYNLYVYVIYMIFNEWFLGCYVIFCVEWLCYDLLDYYVY